VQIIPPREEYRQDRRQPGERGKMGLSGRLESCTDEQGSQRGDGWTRAGDRRARSRNKVRDGTGISGGLRSQSCMRSRRIPRAAVAAIRARDEGVSYAEVLRKARREVSLGELGIETTKIKRGINGSILIEIPGQEGNEKAKILADKLREKLGETEVAITRPTAMGEIRMVGLDESATTEEVRDTIANLGGCKGEDVKVGQIRWMYNGLGTI